MTVRIEDVKSPVLLALIALVHEVGKLGMLMGMDAYHAAADVVDNAMTTGEHTK